MGLPLSLTLLVFAASLAVLLYSADKFVGHTEAIGLSLGVPHFVMGITVLAVGTSFPELITGLFAVAGGASEIVVGTVLGSNIANILLILGITAIVARQFNIVWDLLHGDLPILFGSLLLLAFVIYPLSPQDVAMFADVSAAYARGEVDDLGGRSIVTPLEALVMVAGYVLYIHYYATRRSDEVEAVVATDRTPVLRRSVVWVLVGMAGVLVGAEYTVRAAVDLAGLLGIGSEVVAASMIAFGTSMPELVVAMSAARRRNFEMAIGNVTGSNIFNTFMVLGVPGLVAPFLGQAVPLQVGEPTVLTLQLPYYAGTVLLFLVVVLDRTLTRTEGLLIFLAYVLFIAKLFGAV